MNIKNAIIIAFIAISLFSCDNNRVFEENTDFKLFDWKYDEKVDFEFKLEDTTPKNIFVNFRHTSIYSYRNAILKLTVTNPKGEKEILDINIPLSEPNGMWFGECSGNICDIKYPINYSFTEKGLYVFSFEQNMRENPLTNVMSVGLRIEKQNKK